MNVGYLGFILAILILCFSSTPYVYSQTGQTEISSCSPSSTKHWDKIVFEIKDKKIAQMTQQPFDTELDIKVLDDPKKVADLKKKVLDFLGLPITPENRKAVVIIDVGFAVVCAENKLVLPANGDEDGDGLLNNWELNGMDLNSDNIIDIVLADADPLHKDIYVEADYMTFHKPWVQSISNVVDSFENSPVTNPDGYTGINLHIEVDEQITHQDTTSSADLVNIRNSNFGTVSQRADPDTANILPAKLMVYHYALFGHSQPGSGSSGVSNGIPAMEFLVSLGAPGWGTDPMTGHTVGSVDQQEGTFMHELGHNLNLRHGGSDNINCKPNYLSVMSYTRQFSSLIGDRPLDYSRSPLSSLAESSLDENIGLTASTPADLRTIYGPSPVVITTAGIPQDWNRDNDALDIGVTSDVNDLDGCPPSPNQVLNSFDDWNNLSYITTPAAGITAGPESLVTTLPSLENTTSVTNQTQILEPELTVEDIRQHRVELLESINQTINSLPNTAFSQPQQAEAIKANLTVNPQNRTSDLADLLETDQLDEAIIQLNALKSKTDSSLGGMPAGDLITNSEAQQKVLPLIENLIQVLEKQK